jgi:hypothetical protein
VNIWHVGKREMVLIKDNIAGDINALGWNMETLVTLMKRAISEEHALLRAKIKFMSVVWAKMGPTGTPKHLKKMYSLVSHGEGAQEESSWQ